MPTSKNLEAPLREAWKASTCGIRLQRRHLTPASKTGAVSARARSHDVQLPDAQKRARDPSGVSSQRPTHCQATRHSHPQDNLNIVADLARLSSWARRVDAKREAQQRRFHKRYLVSAGTNGRWLDAGGLHRSKFVPGAPDGDKGFCLTRRRSAFSQASNRSADAAGNHFRRTCQQEGGRLRSSSGELRWLDEMIGTVRPLSLALMLV